MSDYLGHLLERSFTPTPKLRPQSPSLFEPPPNTNLVERPVDWDRTSDIEATPSLPREVRSQNFPKTPSAKSTPGNVSTKPAVPVETSNAPVDASPPARPYSPSAVSKAVDEEIPTGPNASAEISLSPESHKKEGIRLAGHTERTPPSSSEEATATGPAHLAYGTAIETAHRSSSIRDSKSFSPAVQARITSSRPTPSTNESAREERSTPPSGIHPRAVVVATQIPVSAGNPERTRRVSLNHGAPASARMQSNHASPETTFTSPPSSIQVTIGRVEVRATSLPAPARAPARKESGMSLDAYMQRRTEGNRQ